MFTTISLAIFSASTAVVIGSELAPPTPTWKSTHDLLPDEQLPETAPPKNAFLPSRSLLLLLVGTQQGDPDTEHCDIPPTAARTLLGASTAIFAASVSSSLSRIRPQRLSYALSLSLALLGNNCAETLSRRNYTLLNSSSTLCTRETIGRPMALLSRMHNARPAYDFQRPQSDVKPTSLGRNSLSSLLSFSGHSPLSSGQIISVPVYLRF